MDGLQNWTSYTWQNLTHLKKKILLIRFPGLRPFFRCILKAPLCIIHKADSLNLRMISPPIYKEYFWLVYHRRSIKHQLNIILLKIPNAFLISKRVLGLKEEKSPDIAYRTFFYRSFLSSFSILNCFGVPSALWNLERQILRDQFVCASFLERGGGFSFFWEGYK